MSAQCTNARPARMYARACQCTWHECAAHGPLADATLQRTGYVDCTAIAVTADWCTCRRMRAARAHAARAHAVRMHCTVRMHCVQHAASMWCMHAPCWCGVTV
eukprot:6735862-Alexandrium_andersonii.AAC.1